MKILKLLLITISLLLLSNSVFTQNKINKEKHLGKTFYLKSSLIFFDDSNFPQILQNNILFTSHENSFKGDYFDAYDGKILNRESEIKIKNLVENGDFAVVSILYANSEYKIHLLNKSKNDFKKSFKLIFSKKEFEPPYCKKIKTKEKLFKCYGFPIFISNENGREKYFYICEFIGICSGFDGFWAYFDKGKLVEEGYI